MSESYVDLSYRGLPLGRRIKLAQVRPSTAYLELPTPMPVGTTVSIHSDDGMVLEALVRDLHEQVGGSDRSPGMTIAPTLKDDAALAWWHARVTLPEAEPRKRTRDRPHTVRPRSATRPQPQPPPPAEPPPPPPPAAVPETRSSLIVLEQLPSREPEPRVTPVIVETPPPPASIPPEYGRAMTIPDAEPPEHVEVEEIELPRSRTLLGMSPPTDPPPHVQDEAKRTLVMDALDQETLKNLSRQPQDTPVEPARTISNDYPVEDDGLRTQHMDAVDVRALGLEVPSSGPMPVVAAPAPAAEDDGDDDEPSASQSQAAAQPEKKERGGFFRRRKKKR